MADLGGYQSDHGCLRCNAEVTEDDVVFGHIRICDGCTTTADLRELLDVQLSWVEFFRARLRLAEDDLAEAQRLEEAT